MSLALIPKYLLQKAASGVLHDMGHEARKTTKYALKKGLYLAAEVGNQINLAIERTKNAYADSLDMTLEKVDRVFAEQIIKLHGLVEDFEQVVLRGMGDLDAIAQKAKECVLMLPFTDKQPQLSSFSPQTIVLFPIESQICFRFKGTFVFASHKGFAPTFKILDQTFTASQNLLSELVFQVSSRIFEQITDKDAPFIAGNILIPWPKESRTVPALASYNLLFEILPATPGTLSLETITPTVKRIGQSTFQIHSFNTDKKVCEVLINPTPGWSIDRSSAQVQIVGGGQYAKVNEFIFDRPNGLYYKVKTKGNVQVKIAFHEYRNVTDQVTKTEQVELKWGESKNLETPPNSTWKLTYNEYQGVQHQAVMSELKTRFVKVVPAGPTLHIKVKNPTKADKDVFYAGKSSL